MDDFYKAVIWLVVITGLSVWASILLQDEKPRLTETQSEQATQIMGHFQNNITELEKVAPETGDSNQ